MTALAVPNLFQWSGTAKTRMNRPLPSQALDTRFVDPTCDPEWDSVVASHPNSSFFHCAAWTRVLCKTYGHKPISLRFSRNGEPVSLVPLLEVESPFTGRRAVSLPFTDYCGPLFFGECDPDIVSDKLCEMACERHWRYFELRGGKTSRESAGSSVAFYGHSLELRGGPERLFAGLTESVQRAIRKAERSNLRVKVSQSRDSILEFYRLHVRTRRRHGLPPQPRSFFLNIHSEIIKPGLGFVVLARKGSIPVAAAVFFHIGKKAVYKFGASDERHQDLRGNNLVMWKAIQLLAQNGFQTLHLGRTSLENEGLRRFKRAWGTVEETIEYFRFDRTANDWIRARDNVSGFHNAVFARLPLGFNRLLGAMIYPHLD